MKPRFASGSLTTEGIAPEWALLVFRAYLHTKRFKRESQITTNIAHLSAGRFAKIEFPIPPPAEAAEILRRISDALSAADEPAATLLARLKATHATATPARRGRKKRDQ
jgi:type I restriction enzyme S subunit